MTEMPRSSRFKVVACASHFAQFLSLQEPRQNCQLAELHGADQRARSTTAAAR